MKDPVVAPIIVVSGLPRSGTSLMMKMLEAGGMTLLTDNIRTADEDNPKGYYEFERVKKLREGDFAWVPEARGKGVKVISALLSYLPLNFEYRVLFMQRALSEVLASQRQMLIRRGEPTNKVNDADMTRIFQKHLIGTQEWLAKSENISTIYIPYSQLIETPESLITQIDAFVGGGLDLTQMYSVIDPNLYRQGG